MKKTIILIISLITLNMYAQVPFKTGVNFPFYTPTTASINDYLSLVNQCGGKAIRQMIYADVHWKHVEPTNDNWDYTKSDTAFLNPFSLTPIGTLYSIMGNDNIGMQVPWLACSNPFTCFWDPANDSVFSKDYVMQTVNRYKNSTKYWEVANEIESALPPKGLLSVADKRDFLKYNYQWIKTADPTAKVLLPGLVGTCCTYPISNSFSWLRSLLNIGGGNYFDIMNYHDYNAWWTLPAHYDSVQNILSQYNLNKPVWITETSVSSLNLSPITPSYSSVNEQAADVWRRICLLWAKGAQVVLWHSNWSSNDIGAWGEFGLVNNAGIKKKSFHSYKLLNDKISNFNAVNILSLGNVTNNNIAGGNGIWALHFSVNGTNKWVLWSPNNLSYTLTGITSNKIKITEVVPTTVINGGDSAIFKTNTFAVSSGSYYFTQVPSLPILVEESKANSPYDSTQNTISIYPNPTQSQLNLNLYLIEPSTVKIEIIDAAGKILYYNDIGNLDTGSHNKIIDVSYLSSGVYILRTYINEQAIIKKIVLHRAA